MLSKRERDNAKISTNLFMEMMKRIETVDWTYINGVEELIKEGWSYKFNNGLVDTTRFYTRYEEHSLRFNKEGVFIQINLTTGTVVIKDGRVFSVYEEPTVFLSMKEINAINKIVKIVEDLRKDASICLGLKSVI